MNNTLINPDELKIKAAVELEKRRRDILKKDEELLNDPVEWIKTNFYIPETNGPIEIYPAQEVPLREALSVDENGDFKYSTVVWSAIKKSAKSSLAAAVGLWFAFRKPWSTIKVIANNLKQADSRVAYYMRRAIELNPNWSNRWCRNYKIFLPNHSIIEAIPINPQGEAGGNDDFLIFCMDTKTEVLTKDGWKNHKTLSLEDDVATMNPKTHEFEWQKPNSIYNNRYTGEMIGVESHDVDMLVTPDHRIYGKFNSLHREFIVAKNIASSFIPILENNVEGNVISKDTWYTTQYDDVVYCPSTNNGIIYVRRNGKAYWTGNSELWGWRKGVSAYEKMWCFDEETEILTKRGWLFGNDLLESDIVASFDPDKDSLVWEKPKSIFREHYEGEMHFYTGHNFTHCATTDHRLYIKDKKGYSVKRSYDVFNNNDITFRTLDGEQKVTGKEVINYSGNVWCPSVSTGLIIVRRHGKPCVSGNTELTLSPTKYGQSMRWCETYAGFSGESEILENLYNATVVNGECIDEEFEIYKNQGTFTLWMTKPSLPFQPPAYYANERSILTDSEFRRVHQNQWVTSSSKFVPIEWWDRLKKTIPELKSDEQIVIAVDAAISGDSFGMLAVSGMPENEEDEDDKYKVVFSRVWKPPKGNKIEFSTEEKDGPEDTLRWLIDNYDVIEVCYDPYQLEDMMQRLRKEMIVYTYAFGQHASRDIADKELYDMIKEGRIFHSGDEDLREHIRNADQKISGEDARMRIVKRNDGLKIDLCVCLSMSLKRAKTWRL